MNFNDLLDLVQHSRPENFVFLGLGNELRSDDGAGLILFRKLEERPELGEARFLEVRTSPENYLQPLLDSGAGEVVVIDAAKTGARPGTIRMLDSGQFDRNRISTHAFSPDLIERYLNHYRHIHFSWLGIEPLTTKPGIGISPEIRQAIDAFFRES